MPLTDGFPNAIHKVIHRTCGTIPGDPMSPAEHAGLQIVQVAVAAAVPGPFDYLWPAAWSDDLPRPGVRVRVPFGRKLRIGVLLGASCHTDIAPERLKTVESLLDPAPLLDPEDLELLGWAAHYWRHPLGEVLLSAFPTLLRQGNPAQVPRRTHYRLTAEGMAQGMLALQRAPQQARLCALLRAAPAGLPAEALRDPRGRGGSALKALLDKGLVERAEDLTVAPAAAAVTTPLTLNEEQMAAVAALDGAAAQFGVHLLHGVTGSGKTEVYLELVRHALARGRQALVLLPEIGLTPQVVERFRSRLGLEVALYHSAMREGERLQAWLAAQRGEAGVLVGTRSAVFTPMPRLGLIVIDEEHDPSYKQQEGFRFSARDYAVMRARKRDIPLILAAATPSLETLANVRRKRYRRVVLTRRAGGSVTPVYEVVDLRGQGQDAGLSPRLVDALRTTLARGEQSLLFLNRRGYAPVLCCDACGWVADCMRCDAHLVLHLAERRLRCHQCEREDVIPSHCPFCGAAELRPLGLGTERVEQALERVLPEARVVRIDRDAIRHRNRFEHALEAVHEGKVDILLGTQMLAKGHHFPKVTLAAILDADAALYSVDFRAGERLAQLVVQVAGRAGRAERAGRVILQTRHPDHPILHALIRGGYAAYAAIALAEREAAGLPPFGFLALLRAAAGDDRRVQDFIQAAAELAQDAAGAGLQVLGPAPAPMQRRSGLYRWQLLLRSGERTALHRALDRLMQGWAALPQARRVRWSVDVDPIDLY